MFLLTPAIISGESIGSLIHRLIHTNFYPSTMTFFLEASHQQIINHEITRRDIRVLAKLTGHSKEQLINMTLFGLKPRQFIMKNKVKFCPLCIQDINHHKRLWTYHPVTVCVEHRVFLLDTCPACGKTVSIGRLIQGVCNCGMIFREAVGTDVPIDSPFYASNEVIQRFVMGKDLGLDWRFNKREMIQLAERSFHLLQGMPSFVCNGQIDVFHNKKNGLLSNQKQAVAYANLYWMYQDFPQNFCAVLDLFSRKEPAHIRYIQKEHFEDLLSDESFTIVADAYQAFWLSQYDKGVIRSDFSMFKKEKALLQRRKRISKEEVKREWGLTYQAIDELCGLNAIPMDEVLRGKMKRVIIEKDALVRTVQEQNRFIHRGQAAEILGIQRDSVTKLIEAGVLSLQRSPQSRMLLDVGDVQQLLEQCRGVYRESIMQGISFHQAMNKFSVNGLSLAKLITFIQEGHLHPFTSMRDGKLSDSFFDENELWQCVTRIKEEQQALGGYTMTDVIHILKIGEKTMWNYVHTGVLVPDRIVTWKDGRKRYFFHKETVDHFANRS
jgi:hypothetical protein